MISKKQVMRVDAYDYDLEDDGRIVEAVDWSKFKIPKFNGKEHLWSNIWNKASYTPDAQALMTNFQSAAGQSRNPDLQKILHQVIYAPGMDDPKHMARFWNNLAKKLSISDLDNPEKVAKAFAEVGFTNLGWQGKLGQSKIGRLFQGSQSLIPPNIAAMKLEGTVHPITKQTMTVKQVFDEIASGTPIKIARGGKPAYQQSLNTFAESMQSLHSANSAARDRITLLCRYLGGAVVAGGLAVVVNNHNNPTPPIPKTVSEATQMFQDMSSGKSTAKPGDTLTPPQTETPTPTPTPNQLPAGYGTLGPQANPRHKPTGWFDIIPTDDQGNFLKSSDESDVRFVQANNISSLPPIPSVDEVYTQITKCLQNNDMMGLEKLLNNINGINKKVESEYMEAYNKMFGQKHQPPTPTPTQGTPQQ